MDGLRITLFGKFSIVTNNGEAIDLEASKSQELLAYLLIYRQRPHYREKLATLLWPNSTMSQAKSYLRQALWQVQMALGQVNPLSQVEADWIRVNQTPDIWLDVEQFEHTWALGERIRGHALNSAQAEALQRGTALYQGDLLENWYQDWCLFERERLQNIWLSMLEKLVSYCEVNHEYELGIGFVTQILRQDCAHERAYRRLMRLHYVAGNRTAALRTYERCAVALTEELGVKPAERTIALFELIQADHYPLQESATGDAIHRSALLNHLLHLHGALIEAQKQVAQEIDTLKSALRRQ
jgi:DNA-binding SARP family transcriptional activator